MPKEVFVNLPEAKRKKFIEIALSEFASKPFDQVSVNSIIKEANISRGSFYNYFNNLDELFLFLFESVKEERYTYASKFIKESKGNFFQFIRKLFDYDYHSYFYKEKYSLFRNYVHFVRYNHHRSIKDEIIKPLVEMSKTQGDIEDIFDLSPYWIDTKTFYDIFEMIMILTLDLFTASETNDLSQEEVFRIFNLRLSIIEKGIKK